MFYPAMVHSKLAHIPHGTVQKASAQIKDENSLNQLSYKNNNHC